MRWEKPISNLTTRFEIEITPLQLAPSTLGVLSQEFFKVPLKVLFRTNAWLYYDCRVWSLFLSRFEILKFSLIILSFFIHGIQFTVQWSPWRCIYSLLAILFLSACHHAYLELNFNPKGLALDLTLLSSNLCGVSLLLRITFLLLISSSQLGLSAALLPTKHGRVSIGGALLSRIHIGHIDHGQLLLDLSLPSII